eukprot:900907-Prymnesium_polylepis.1
MLIGPIMLGYILSRITDLVGSIDIKGSRRRSRMAALKLSFRDALLPREMQKRMLSYYSKFLSEGSDYTAEQGMLLRLPPPLKLELVLFLSKEMILNISLFRGQEPAFIVSVCKVCRRGPCSRAAARVARTHHPRGPHPMPPAAHASTGTARARTAPPHAHRP